MLTTKQTILNITITNDTNNHTVSIHGFNVYVYMYIYIYIYIYRYYIHKMCVHIYIYMHIVGARPKQTSGQRGSRRSRRVRGAVRDSDGFRADTGVGKTNTR